MDGFAPPRADRDVDRHPLPQGLRPCAATRPDPSVLLPGVETEIGIGELATVFAAWLLPAVLLFAQPSIQIQVGPRSLWR